MLAALMMMKLLLAVASPKSSDSSTWYGAMDSDTSQYYASD